MTLGWLHPWLYLLLSKKARPGSSLLLSPLPAASSRIFTGGDRADPAVLHVNIEWCRLYGEPW